jgi:hypothetical protein
MPYVTRIDCPNCDKPLVRKPGGRCPHCGHVISEHVARARLREKRIEQVVAVVSTLLVLGLFLWAGGVGLIEGIIVYAAAGLLVWYWGKGTFWSATLRDDGGDIVDDDA